MIERIVLVLAVLAAPVHADPINAVIGDASWTAGAPDRADEVVRIQTHLRHVRDRLARTSAAPRPLLAALDGYIARGDFPRRTGDPYPGRRPRFVDDRGVWCAVGYLIVASGHPELARAIAAAHEYDYIRDIDDPALAAWAATNGFTRDELAMIQPSYRAVPTAASTRRRIEDAKDTITLACAREHPPLAAVALQITGDDRGRATATTESTDPFARCVAEQASQVETGGGAYAGSPARYRFAIELQLAAPQALFEQRVARLELRSECTPRPGAIPAELALELAGSSEGLVVHATTRPDNTEVDACIERRVRSGLRDFAGIAPLAAKRTIRLVSQLAPEVVREHVASYARGYVTDCYPETGAPDTVVISVVARRDDADFTLSVATPNADFAHCVIGKLAPSLREQYAVPRERPDGSYERYFRIDTDVRVSVAVPVESPASRDERVRRYEEERRRRRRPRP